MSDKQNLSEYVYSEIDGIEYLKLDNTVYFTKENEEYRQIEHQMIEKKSREEIINLFQTYIEQEKCQKESSFDDFNSEDDQEGKPYKPSDVKYERKQMTCEELFNQLTGYNGEEEPSIILDPEFQRKSVWKAKDETLFIESILLNIPIPSIYVNETREKKYIVADGRQRLTAIRNFMENKLKLKNTEYGKKKYEGKHFRGVNPNESLSAEEIRHFRRFSIDVNVIKEETPDQVKLDIFGRLNSRGVKLNSQELRNSIMNTRLRSDLEEIENTPIVDEMINSKVNTNRYLHYELYLRYFAFESFFNNESLMYKDKLEEEKTLTYKGNGKGYLDEYVIYLNQCKQGISDGQKEKYYSNLIKLQYAFGESAFRREVERKDTTTGDVTVQKSRINTLLYIVLLHEYSSIPLEKVRETGNINKEFQKFIREKLIAYTTSATNNIPNILETEKLTSKFIKEKYE